MRGKKNEPSFIRYTADKLSLIKEIPVNQIIDLTTKNFNNLFDIKQIYTMSLRFTILGSGSSMGVPRADSFFGKCDPKEKKNYRTNSESFEGFRISL